MLAVSDLHVGYEAALREKGFGLPRHELDALVPVLDALLDEHRPDVLVLNGDVKHAFQRRLVEESQGVKALWRRLADRARVIIVEGNHDTMLRRILPDAEIVPHHRAGRVLFAHGHRAEGVDAAPNEFLVLGHEHPSLDLRDEVGVSVRARTFLESRGPRRRTLVLPALAPWAAGYDVLRRDPFMSPLLSGADRGAFRALALAGEEVLDFGEVARLRRVMRTR